MYYVHLRPFKSELSLLQYCTSYVNIQSGGVMVLSPSLCYKIEIVICLGISEIQILSISKQLKKTGFGCG